ncbi:MAG: transglycosylase SLT domain-containing protein [Bacteroidales bacterium]|nr:transglycosylase SLT domain-containing protein [Bacteroidales bacterium]MDD4656110.1 transglycosylase SLT domain-containing protein [Bacteroidales bacterium]
MRPIIKFIFAITFILLHPVLSSSDIGTNGSRDNFLLEGESLNAMVNIKGGIYLNQGHPVGFHFELLNRFASHQKCDVRVAPVQESNPWDLLLKGNIDILVINSETDTIPKEYSNKVVSSLSLNQKNQVWIVTKENYPILQNMNSWFNYYSYTKEYKKLQSKYYTNYRRLAFPSGPVKVLSPYDQIIKEYSKTIDWDWRLLASLIYQESKFSVSAKSHRNAYGLMQVLPSTAKHYNVEDLYDPKQNIKAGTLFIKRLIGLYKSSEIDSLNQIKFVLAAYNAGEGRLQDIRRAAQYKSINSNNWDSLKTVIPYMSLKGELPEDLLRHGSFKGTETLNFVDQIVDRYENYKMLVKK